MARRKVKNGEKNPWGQCLTRPVGTGLVRHCPQGFFSPFFTFLRAIYFSARLDFSSSPLSAPGSPRMLREVNSLHFTRVSVQHPAFQFQRFRHCLDQQTRSIRPLQTDRTCKDCLGDKCRSSHETNSINK